MNWRRTILAATVLLGGCSTSTSDATWVTESMEQPLDGDVVFEDGPIRLVDVAGPTNDCAQLVVGDVATSCPTISEGSSMGPMPIRSGTAEVIWVAASSEIADRSIRFVVFSSSSPAGRSIDAVDVDGTSHLVWQLEPGEQPWGVQLLGPSGELVSAAGIAALPD